MSTTSTESTSAAAPATASPESSEISAEGIFINPEVVKVPVPKGCRCELRLAFVAGSAFATHPEGEVDRWWIGYHLEAGKESNVGVYPRSVDSAWPSRTEAIGAGLAAALQFFEASPSSRLHKKCASAVKSYASEVASGAIAAAAFGGKQAPAPVALPEPLPADVPLDGLEENPHNPRGPISEESVAELAETIREVGLLQPVGVRALASGPNQLLWGHRRAAAFRKLGRTTIPARHYGLISDGQARLLLLIENGQQKALDPIQEARGFAEMARDFGLKQDEIAAQVKKSRPVVANAMRLLELPATVQSLIASRTLTTAHGMALLRYKDFPEACSRMAELAVDEQTTAGDLEELFPFEHTLQREGLIVKVPSSYVASAELVKTGIYAQGDYGAYFLDPQAWKLEAAKLAEEKKAERAKQKKLAAKGEANAAAKKKVLRPIEDGEYVTPEESYLLDLVPEAKVAKGETRAGEKCTLVLDKPLWSSITQTAREIVALERKAAALPLIEAAWKRAAAMKKMDGFAAACLIMCPWFETNTFSGPVAKRLKLGLAKHEKAVLDKGRGYGDGCTVKINELAKCDGLELAKLAFGLIVADLEDDIQRGSELKAHWAQFISGKPAVPGLLQTEKGRAEICRRVAEEMAPHVGDTVQWEADRKDVQGTVITPAEYEKGTGAKWDFKGATPVKRFVSHFGDPYAAVHTDALLVITRFVAPAAKTAKGGKK